MDKFDKISDFILEQMDKISVETKEAEEKEHDWKLSHLNSMDIAYTAVYTEIIKLKLDERFDKGVSSIDNNEWER